MQSIDLSKISSRMTSKERAKLFVTLELKDMANLCINSFSPSTCEALYHVWSSCPDKERAQFVSYLVMKSFIWNVATFDIASKLTHLQALILSGKHDAKIWQLIEDLRNFGALVETIEAKHFDGAEILSRDQKSSMGTMAWITQIVALAADELGIDPLPEVNTVWVEKYLALAEEGIINQ